MTIKCVYEILDSRDNSRVRYNQHQGSGMTDTESYQFADMEAENITEKKFGPYHTYFIHEELKLTEELRTKIGIFESWLNTRQTETEPENPWPTILETLAAHLPILEEHHIRYELVVHYILPNNMLSDDLPRAVREWYDFHPLDVCKCNEYLSQYDELKAFI